MRYFDAENNQVIDLLTNHCDLSGLGISDLYRMRWQVELFFKWIKQHLRIKAFYGTSENAVKTQIWIAVCVYTLVAIVRKELKIPSQMYTILQVLSVTLFEKTPILSALSNQEYKTDLDSTCQQLNLFDL